MAKVQLSGYRCVRCGCKWLPRKQEDGKRQANSRVPKVQESLFGILLEKARSQTGRVTKEVLDNLAEFIELSKKAVPSASSKQTSSEPETDRQENEQ